MTTHVVANAMSIKNLIGKRGQIWICIGILIKMLIGGVTEAISDNPLIRILSPYT